MSEPPVPHPTPSERQLEAAFWAWTQATGRDEVFAWFRSNWSALPGLREFVDREARGGKRS